MSQPRHIIIAGAGIGGLSAALACAQRGMHVTVIETAQAFGEIGAGIQIPPNAMRVLRALGLEALIRERAFEPEALQARMGESGRELFHVKLRGAAEARWGAPYLHIHRADYIDALAQGCALDDRITVRFGHSLTDYETHEGVTVTLSSGETLRADALIGADGIHSTIREIMHGPGKARFTGNMAWRAVVPTEALGDLAPPPTACLWMGRGRHCVTYRLRGGALSNLVAVVERGDWRGEGWTEAGELSDALSDFEGWHPTIGAMLQRADTLHRWALFDRPPLQSWVHGPVALLGDAAHPMLPFMAQGAAMAVEDAWVLAQELAGGDRPGLALERYQTLRFDRVSKMQVISRSNAATFHQRRLAGQLKTYGPMWLAGRLAPTAVLARQDWIYGHDVIQSVER